ncbi:MAG: YraN family protein [bacterium]|nr:YraN family protein [bacterium]
MTHKSEVGKFGEDLACEYLVKHCFTVIERNFRKPWGELDVIAMAPDKTLVIVEVKTMKESGNPAIAELNPEDNLTAAKLQKLQRTAILYANQNPNLVNDERGWRIDLIAITLINGKEPLIKYFENL